MQPKFYLLTEKELQDLLRQRLRLASLEEYGVDNWHGYGPDEIAYYQTNDPDMLEYTKDQTIEMLQKQFRDVSSEATYSLGNQARDIMQKLYDYLVKKNDYETVIDLFSAHITAGQAFDFLEELGYKHEEMDTNGWELDYWVVFTKEGSRPIIISGSGIYGGCTMAFHETQEEDSDGTF